MRRLAELGVRQTIDAAAASNRPLDTRSACWTHSTAKALRGARPVHASRPHRSREHGAGAIL